MITALGFAVLAGAGAVARAEAGRRWNRHEDFPLGTLAVNVAGAFGLGLLSRLTGPAVTVIGVGGLGTFTTVSSFARDALALLELRRAAMAAAYVTLTVALGTAGAWAGMSL